MGLILQFCILTEVIAEIWWCQYFYDAFWRGKKRRLSKVETQSRSVKLGFHPIMCNGPRFAWSSAWLKSSTPSQKKDATVRILQTTLECKRTQFLSWYLHRLWYFLPCMTWQDSFITHNAQSQEISYSTSILLHSTLITIITSIPVFHWTHRSAYSARVQGQSSIELNFCCKACLKLVWLSDHVFFFALVLFF